MRIRNILTLVLAIAIMAIVIIGLLRFDLMLEIWVKVLIGVLFAGVIFTAVRQFRSQNRNGVILDKQSGKRLHRVKVGCCDSPGVATAVLSPWSWRDRGGR